MLPEGLEFLKPGWWLIHLIAVALIASYAYRQGRADERKSKDEDREPPRGTEAGPAEKR